MQKEISLKIDHKKLLTLLAFGGIIFVAGGGIDFVLTLISHNPANPLEPIPTGKLTAFSPAAMFFYTLGFTGMLMLVWSGTEYHKNIKLAEKRLTAAIILLAVCSVGLELIYKFGYGGF